MTIEQGRFQRAEEPPTLGHLIRDLVRAAEEGRFQVETPTLHVEQPTFERVAVNEVGGPRRASMLQVELEWHDDDYTLVDELNDHINHEGAIALHGDMHVWNVDCPIDGELGATFDPSNDGGFDCEARLGWQEFALAGWV